MREVLFVCELTANSYSGGVSTQHDTGTHDKSCLKDPGTSLPGTSRFLGPKAVCGSIADLFRLGWCGSSLKLWCGPNKQTVVDVKTGS